jgi:hypothetical protein
MILEDNESDTSEPKPKTIIVSASVNASANPAFDLNKLVYLSSYEI